MRKILRDKLWMMVVIGVLFFAQVSWGQEKPKPPTLKQAIADQSYLIKALKLKLSSEVNNNVHLSAIVARQEDKLNYNAAKLAQCERKPEKVKDEKVPDNDDFH